MEIKKKNDRSRIKTQGNARQAYHSSIILGAKTGEPQCLYLKSTNVYLYF
ncbi:hypothetical protein HS072_00930 [Mannheimia haemolytica]